jgi:cellulose synthase/poly-beta-1,6-N-acetylglucosamine synthase-like glycosyltransferase
MRFPYTRTELTGRDSLLERVLECIPGILSWGTLLGLVVLSALLPSVAAAIMLTFLYYWLIRIIYYAVFLVIAFGRLWVEGHTDWMARVRDLYAPELPELRSVRGFRRRRSLRLHRRVKQSVAAGELALPPLDAVRQLVIVPVYSESREVVEPGIRAIAQSDFPSDRITFILAVEERSPEWVKEYAEELHREYASAFERFMITIHPDGVPGEVKAKGANATFAAKQAELYFNANGIDYENVIVSCFDADTVPGRDYFACLTYSFLACPERTRASFQPIPLYDNNIWRVPFYARVLEMGSSVFQLVESTNHDLLVSFSSHSSSFRALVDADYWPVDLIPDDSAIYWKSLIEFDGDFRVVPIPTTLSMDASEASSFWQTFVNTYKQKFRWAWGVENVPIAARGILKSARMHLTTKVKYIVKLFDTYFIWATWPFLLTILGWLPPIFGRLLNIDALAVFNFGRITPLIFQLASVNIILMIGISAFFIFRSEQQVPLRRKLLYPLEWVLLPIVTVFFSGIPALHAQTRLLLNRPLEFWASEKRRDEAQPAQ